MFVSSHLRTSPSPESRAKRRFERLREMRRLRRNAEILIAAHPGVTGLGGNDDAEDAALSCGLDLDDFAVFDLRVGVRRATMICVPTRHWQDPATMKVFLQAKAAIAELGHAAILVPQSFIQRQPRLETATMIQDASDFDVNPCDRMAILAFLIENGSATLSDLAMLVRGPHPVSAVLHLVTTGALCIDIDAAVSPASMLTMGEPAR